MADDRVQLTVDGPIAVITNNNPEKHNAFDDDMDAALFDILGEIKADKSIRAVVWRGEGKSWSSGRDVSAIGGQQVELAHHALMERGHRGIQQLWDIDAPVIVAMQGWAIGGSFQRALLCDIRVAAEGARFMLPEVTHGVIPDTGGVGRLFEICGSGLVNDMVLTGRILTAEEALTHGIISRITAPEELQDHVMEMAEKIAAAPPYTVQLARRVIRNLADEALRRSMNDEYAFQTLINRSDDFEEFRVARVKNRTPHYRRS
ncbi:enoyl-CoA hydratase/isomerase family protein [Candidatus Poriferisocius sp.]|uniref:enoyl-CoA hydratase/isomerase family protein n=1 Tax=Candidatus Poriferisocius sp. TaxID=3101276 RepID=UPI003B5AE3DA